MCLGGEERRGGEVLLEGCVSVFLFVCLVEFCSSLYLSSLSVFIYLSLFLYLFV